MKVSPAWLWHGRKSGNFNKSWSWFFFSKIPLWPCCHPAWFCQAWTNHSALNINGNFASAKLLYMCVTPGEGKRKKEERNLEVAIFIQLIHCFVVKVIEVTVLSDLCGNVFLSGAHWKKNKWMQATMCLYVVHSTAAALLQTAKNPLYWPPQVHWWQGHVGSIRNTFLMNLQSHLK